MTRRVLATIAAAGALALTACGADRSATSAPEPTVVASEQGGGAASGTARSSADDAGTLQAEADRVLEEIFEGDRDTDYEAIANLTSGAVAARYRNQELLSSIEGLDQSFTTPAMAAVAVTGDLAVGEPTAGIVDTTGSVTATYTGDDGVVSSFTYTDVVFEEDGGELRVADWRSATEALPASAVFLDTDAVAPGTSGDLTVTLEPGYRDPDADPAFVEYLFSVTNGSDVAVEVTDVEMMAPDNELYAIQFGTAATVEPGTTVPARVGYQGPGVPVAGGTMHISLEDESTVHLVIIDVPAFLDEDGEPEAPRPIELDDVEFSASGTGGHTATDEARSEPRDPDVLQEITDAASFRDSLLDLAETENDPRDAANAWGIPDAWMAAVPGLELVGVQIEATPTTVSGFAITGDKDGTSEGLPFAVMDASGTCAGGVVMGLDGRPVAFRTVDLTGATECSAATVMELVGLG